MKKQMRRQRWRRCINKKVAQIILSAEGSAGLLHKISKPTAWRGGAHILKKEEEDVRLLDRCEAKRKNGQSIWKCNESVQNLEDKLWKNEKSKKPRGSAAKAEGVSFGIGIETVQDENRSGMLRLPLQGPSGCDNRHERRSRRVLGEGRAEWEMAAASLHDDVLLNSEEPHE